MKRSIVVRLFACLTAFLPYLAAQGQVSTFTRWFGGPKYDEAFCVQALANGGFVIAGTSLTLTGSFEEVFAIRLDCAGDTVWVRTVGGRGHDDGFSICQTFDGGFAIAGTKSSSARDTVSAYVVKLDSAGTLEWTNKLRYSLKDLASSVCETRDSGLAIAGVMGSGPHGRSDARLMKMNRDGDTLWTRTYGGAADDGLLSILSLPDGGFLLTGYTNSLGAGAFDCLVIRTDELGDTLWTRTYGGPDDETGWSADTTDDSCFVIGGVLTHGIPPSGSAQFFLVKVQGDGDTVWTRTIDGATSDSRFSVRHTGDGGFAFVGTTPTSGREEDALLVKTDRWGEAQWRRTFGTQSFDKGSSVQQCQDGGFIVAGMVSENTYDAYLVKTDEQGLIAGMNGGTETGRPKLFHLSQNYPNPFNPVTSFQFTIDKCQLTILKVYDLLGQEVATLVNEVKQPGDYSVRFDASTLASGIYFYRLMAGGYVAVKKLVVMK